MPNCRDAQSQSSAVWLRLAGMGFGLATQVFFLITVPFLFLYLRDGGSQRTSHWLAIDCLLALQFALVHSVLLLPGTRSFIVRFLPAQLYGCLFCLTTCAGLW